MDEAKSTLDAARFYLSMEYSVIPLEENGKKPAIPWKEFQTRKPTDAELVTWFGNGSRHNIGIVTGAISGLAVVDLDTKEAVDLVESKGGLLTPTVKTGKGYHLYCKYQDGIRNFQKRADLPGIDLRAEGGYVVARPSVHESGHIYQWVKDRGLDLPLADLPSWILAEKPEDKQPITELYNGIDTGGRNMALTRLIGSFLNDHKGITLPELIDMACLWNKALENPLPLDEVKRTCKSIFDKHHDHDTPKLKTVSIFDLMQYDFPVLAYLLYPILHTQSLNMIHAWRGIGKTFFGLCLAYAVASGGKFLKWHAEKPRGVLYLDGEMPGNSLQARLAGIIDSNENEPPPGFFQVLTPDLQEPGNMPDLSTPEGQAAIDALVTPDTALIVVDNLSCFLRSGRENESESWLPVQGWALRHRAAGRTVLFIHHSGKGGTQRGSSKKEDVLDLVLNLKRPIDYEPSQGACFEVVFEKSRHLTGADTASFEATLSTDEHGKQLWVFKDVVETTYERVCSLFNEGLSQADIASELGINKSNVCRYIRKAKDQGKIIENSKVA